MKIYALSHSIKHLTDNERDYISHEQKYYLQTFQQFVNVNVSTIAK